MGLEKLKKAIEAKKVDGEVGPKKAQGVAGSRARGVSTPEAEKTEAVKNSEAKLAELRKNEPAVRRVVRASLRLADRLTDADQEEFANVIRRCLNAKVSHYDPKLRRAVETPDYKTQLAAATLGLAYVEGTPVKRIAAIVGDLSGAKERVDAMKESPEAMRAIRALSGLGVEIDIEAEVIQETGSEISDVASEENADS